VWLHHPLLMAGRAEMDKIAEAIDKIRRRAADLAS